MRCMLRRCPTDSCKTYRIRRTKPYCRCAHELNLDSISLYLPQTLDILWAVGLEHRMECGSRPSCMSFLKCLGGTLQWHSLAMWEVIQRGFLAGAGPLRSLHHRYNF